MLTLDIFGIPYTVSVSNDKENPKLKDADGICETYSKEIIVDHSGRGQENALNNIEDYFRKVLRHEAFHALFHEAGFDQYSQDETLVDALATLYPRIESVMQRIERIDTTQI